MEGGIHFQASGLSPACHVVVVLKLTYGILVGIQQRRKQGVVSYCISAASNSMGYQNVADVTEAVGVVQREDAGTRRSRKSSGSLFSRAQCSSLAMEDEK